MVKTTNFNSSPLQQDFSYYCYTQPSLTVNSAVQIKATLLNHNVKFEIQPICWLYKCAIVQPDLCYFWLSRDRYKKIWGPDSQHSMLPL